MTVNSAIKEVIEVWADSTRDWADLTEPLNTLQKEWEALEAEQARREDARLNKVRKKIGRPLLPLPGKKELEKMMKKHRGKGVRYGKAKLAAELGISRATLDNRLRGD